MSAVIPPYAAGTFYPHEPGVLRRTIQTLLAAAEPRVECIPAALIVPHAGYVYSGGTAAAGYALLAQNRESVSQVVLLGPAHRSPISGAVIPRARAMTTPLGEVPIAEELCGRLIDRKLVEVADHAFRGEHSLEVQLPFLQQALPGCPIVPILFGVEGERAVAAVLKEIVQPGVVVVVSSDLSHYLADRLAREIDGQTSSIIERLAFEDLEDDRACGAAGIRGLLSFARARGWNAVVLQQTNSSEAFGDTDRVVGYGAYAFSEPPIH